MILGRSEPALSCPTATRYVWRFNFMKVKCYWKFSSSFVQFSSVAQSCLTLCSLSITNSWSLLKCMSIESVMPSNHLILGHPLSSCKLLFPSIRVFSNESALCIRWPEYWSFSFSISPSQEYSELIFFRTDWFDSSCSPRDSQHHSLKVSILWLSAFFTVQLSHQYMTTGKTMAFTKGN